MDNSTDLLFQKILDSLPSSIVVLNKDGCIEMTNASWDRFCLDNKGDLRLLEKELII
jgi:hypothetical protein